MSKARRTCPICGKPMPMGARVTVNLGWETGTLGWMKHSKFTIVCRKCAAEFAMSAHVEIPEEVGMCSR